MWRTDGEVLETSKGRGDGAQRLVGEQLAVEQVELLQAAAERRQSVDAGVGDAVAAPHGELAQRRQERDERHAGVGDVRQARDVEELERRQVRDARQAAVGDARAVAHVEVHELVKVCERVEGLVVDVVAAAQLEALELGAERLEERDAAARDVPRAREHERAQIAQLAQEHEAVVGEELGAAHAEVLQARAHGHGLEIAVGSQRRQLEVQQVGALAQQRRQAAQLQHPLLGHEAEPLLRRPEHGVPGATGRGSDVGVAEREKREDVTHELERELQGAGGGHHGTDRCAGTKRARARENE